MSVMRRLIQRFREQRGQAIIEFAFIAPILFVFLFTIVDFGIAMDRRIMVQHAVREGARFAAVDADCQAIRQTTSDQAQDIISPADVTVSYDANPAERGDRVEVSAAFTYEPWIFNSIGKLFGVSSPAIDMSPDASARLEQAVTDASGCSGP